MGWGITINTDLYYSKVNYRSKDDVDNRIKEISSTIEFIKSQILKYSYMTEPKKFIPEEHHDNIMGYIEDDVNTYMEELDDLMWERTRLYILSESWDDAHHKETGKAMVPYNPNELNRVWMHGDFIEMCTPDGKEIPEDYWDKYKYGVIE